MGLFDWGKSVESAGSGVSNVIESLRFGLTGDMPPEEKVKIKELIVRLEELNNKVKTGIVELANIDAKSSSKFQSWWRPLIGWVCGISLAMYFIPQYAMGAYVWLDIINSMTHTEVVEHGLPGYPVKADAVLELVFALLGMGIIRSVDKKLGTAK